jgi:prevent-host-death family protein
MDEVITATTARRRFAEFRRRAKNNGETFLITKHGKPIARIIPPAMIYSKPSR